MSSEALDLLNAALVGVDSPECEEDEVLKLISAFADSLPVDFKARLFNILKSQLFVTKPKDTDTPDGDIPPVNEQADCPCPPDDVMAMRPDFGEDIQKIMSLDINKIQVKKKKKRF